MAANTASAVLVSSNPTNVLIAGSFGLNFLTGFTKWTILPSVIPAIVNFPILLAMFWKQIPQTLVPLQDNPWSKLRDPTGAVFFSTLMLVTVGVLVGTSFVPGHVVEVWMVTAPAGILAFLFDLGSDWWQQKQRRTIHERGLADAAAEMRPIDRTGSRTSSTRRRQSSTPPPSRRLPQHTLSTNPSSAATKQASPDPDHDPKEPRTLTTLCRSLRQRFPGTAQTLSRLPLLLLPFAACQFILVRGLAQRSWIRTFAHASARACTTPLSSSFFFGFIAAALLCPLAGTNIGAAVILVEILRDPAFAEAAAVARDPRVRVAGIYATALGSNLGAFSYTFAGSLAGLLWRGLLRDKGVIVGPVKFAVVNLGPLVVQTALACAIIYGQVFWFM